MYKLMKHIMSLCVRNLNSKRVKCCAECPFEDQIVKAVPNLKQLFEKKRKEI